jgi:lipopolysaccharide biosynthesis glycosyltransferase
MHAIVMASDTSAISGLAVTGYTALLHASEPLAFWIVADGIDARTQGQLRACWLRTGKLAAVHFLRPPHFPVWFRSGKWPAIAWSRCMLSDLLPPDVSKYVYLDIDLLVGRDVVELFQMDLDGCPAAMVLNSGMGEVDQRYVGETLGLDPDDYYNSGVAVLDIAQFRCNGYDAALLEQCRRMPVEPWFPDQDVFNVFFRGRIKRMETGWNLRDANGDYPGNVIHFAGGPKPWKETLSEDGTLGAQRWHALYRELGFATPMWRPPGLLQIWSERVYRKALRQALSFRRRLN